MFSSEPFQCGRNIKWRIKLMPQNENKECVVGLQVMKFPSHISKIVTHYQMCWTQMKASLQIKEEFIKIKDTSWQGIVCSSVMQDFVAKCDQAVQIRVHLTILQIWENQKIILENKQPLNVLQIDEFNMTMNINKDKDDYKLYLDCPQSGNIISSEMLLDNMWGIALAPDGYDEETRGILLFGIYGSLLPMNVDKVFADLKLVCPEAQVEYNGNFVYSYEPEDNFADNYYFWDTECMTFEQFKQYQSLTFEAIVTIKHIMIGEDKRSLSDPEEITDQDKFEEVYSDTEDIELKNNVNEDSRYTAKQLMTKKFGYVLARSYYKVYNFVMLQSLSVSLQNRMAMKTYGSGDDLIVDSITIPGAARGDKSKELRILYDRNGEINQEFLQNNGRIVLYNKCVRWERNANGLSQRGTRRQNCVRGQNPPTRPKGILDKFKFENILEEIKKGTGDHETHKMVSNGQNKMVRRSVRNRGKPKVTYYDDKDNQREKRKHRKKKKSKISKSKSNKT